MYIPKPFTNSSFFTILISLQNLIKLAPKLSHIYLNITNSQISHVLSKCTNLQHIEIGDECSSGITDKLIRNNKKIHTYIEQNMIIHDPLIFSSHQHLKKLTLCEIEFNEQLLCPNLQILEIYNSDNLANLSMFSKCRKLRTLYIHNCKLLTNISALQNFKKLRTLIISNCEALSDISPFQCCKNLHRIKLRLCPSIITIPSLCGCSDDEHNCNKLYHIGIYDCEKLKTIEAKHKCSYVRHLSMHNCPELEVNIPKTVSLHNLKTLKLYSFTRIYFLKKCVNLRILELSECDIEDICGFSRMQCLTKLNLSNCNNIDDLTSLNACRNLEIININGCSDTAQTFNFDIQCFKKLRELYMKKCDNIKILSFGDCKIYLN